MQLVGFASHKGHMHVVEVTVPVTVEAAQPESLFLRAISWFSDAPAAAKVENINASLSKLFTNTERIEVNEALVRYKTLMIQEYGATDVQIQLRHEGADIIVVELLGSALRLG